MNANRRNAFRCFAPILRWGALLGVVTALPALLAGDTTAQHNAPDQPPTKNSSSPASPQDALSSTNLIRPEPKSKKTPPKDYQQQIETARQLRRSLDPAAAEKLLVNLLDSELPPEFRRAALFELALVAQEQKQYPRAQQILAQFLKLYPQDPAAPEVLLRQGLIFRQMGAHNAAIAKFYAVMNTALGLKLEQFDYYQRLVLQAQTEIADTYLLQGKFNEAADFFTRLLKQNSAGLNRPQIQFKLIRCLASLGRHKEVVAQCEAFFEAHPDAAETPELRFVCASSLKQLGRLGEALRQVLRLLESQEAAADANPENWRYWQQRAGNDIANQLYLEGDYLNALQVYHHLSQLDSSAAWQLPVWYQAGLIYERLLQPKKAVEMYDAILAREKELTGSEITPSLKTVLEMAKWRKDQITWRERTEVAVHALRLSPIVTAATNTSQSITP